MNLAEFFAQGLTLVSTSNPKIIVFLFLLCLIGETAGLFVPYLLETIWLLVGYQFSVRVLSLPDLLLIALAAQVGRLAGALILYQISASGSTLLAKYQNYFRKYQIFFRMKAQVNDTMLFKVFRKINLSSPFAVALGRLLWLRIPLTLILGAQHKLKALILGVSLSTFIYDAIYIAMGAIIGTTTVLDPVHLILYSLAGLTAMYGILFAIRRLVSGLTRRRQLETTRRSD
ncbi:MAG: putative rane protein [Dehalococcoidales bacterium]|nr:putative rane protein [Dehalococcoidales bacterium]